LIASLVVFVFACGAHAQTAPCDRAATTILVVRHAERPGEADSLSAAGFDRAQILSHVAANAGVKAIYHSDTKRNQLAAAPTAKALGITPTVYPAKETDALVAKIFAAAGGPTIPDLADDEFDRLFVVVAPPCRCGSSTLVEVQYGAPSPRPAAPLEREVAALPSKELPPELARVLTDYEAAWAKGDENALANLFAEDGFVLSGGSPPVRGRDAIKQHYQDAGGGPLSLRALDFSTEGDAGFIIGAYGRAKGEKDVGKFTLTLRKEKGRWLIMSDMDNSNRR
jgi:ketosteroid isomerase-like protein